MNLPLFFISSKHPLGVQGDMQSSKSPRESFPAFDSWSLHKFKKVSKIQHVWNSFKIFEEALVLFFLDKAPVLLLRTSWVHNIRIEKINSKAGGVGVWKINIMYLKTFFGFQYLYQVHSSYNNYDHLLLERSTNSALDF